MSKQRRTRRTGRIKKAMRGFRGRPHPVADGRVGRLQFPTPDGMGRFLEPLEPRVLLAADPVLSPISDVTVLGGSPLVIPLNGTDPEGTPLTFSAVSSDPGLVTTDNFEGNRSLRITVGGFGVMELELFENIVPRVTDHIFELADIGFYDGVIFHRVIDGFVIQGGDPTGTGSGGSPLGDFDDQFDVRLQHNQGGLLSMAKSSDDTNDSQFFITEVATRSLDFNHSIFGVITSGEDVREAISNTATDASDKPLVDVVMDSVEIFVDEDSGVLLLSAPEGAAGETDITVTVTDGEGNTDTQMFHVTVEPDTSNGAPFLEDVPEIRLTEGDMASFTLGAIDPEDDAMFFDATVDSGTFVFSIDNDTGAATVTPEPGFTGELGFFVGVRPVTASDTGSGLEFDTQLIPVFVDALEAVNPITDVEVAEDATDTIIDLDVVFTDPGAGEPLTFTVEANTNDALVTTSIVDGELTLAYTADGSGTADITVRATNGGGVSAEDTFTVTVLAENDMPVIEEGQTFEAVGGSPAGTVLGTVVASDVDAGDVLTFAITAGNETGAVAIDAATGELTIADAAAFAAGVIFDLTVEVSDIDGLTDSATVIAQVNPLAAVNPIDDVAVDEDAADTVIDLSDVFDNPDGGLLTYTVTANTDEELVTTSVTDDMLTLGFIADANGTADITVRATNEGGVFGEDTFTVTVAPAADAPVVEDQGFNAVAGTTAGTGIGTVAATDVDTGDVLTFAITAGNETGAMGIDSLTGEVTVADAAAFAAETTVELTVEVTDSDGLSDTATVSVSVDPLEVITPIDDVAADEDAFDAILDLSGVFTDVGDGGPLVFTVETNTNVGLVETSVAGGTLTLDYVADANGTADITVRATNGGVAFVEDTFTVTVASRPDDPKIGDQAFGAPPDTAAGTVIATVAATDADADDTLTYTITGGNEAGALALDAATGELSIADADAFSSAAEAFVLTVEVEDLGGLTDAATVTVDLIESAEIDTGAEADDGEDDVFDVSVDGGELVVEVNGVETFRKLLFTVTALTLDGSTDNDTLNVSFAGGDPVPDGGIFFNGGGPGDNDTLVVGDGSAALVTHTFTAVDSGSVDMDGSVITYTGLEPIFDNLDATDRVFDFGDAADEITVRDDATAEDGISEIVSVASSETVAFVNPTGSLTVNAGGGDDVLTVEMLDGTVDFDVVMNTGDGDDSVDSSDADFLVVVEDEGGNDVIKSGAGGSVRRVEGTDANDKITVRQKNDRLRITVNGETRTTTIGGGELTIEVIGLAGNDRINFVSLTSESLANGGDGDDRINASGVRNANVLLFGGEGNDLLIGGKGADVLDGGGGNDKIFGGNGGDQIFGGDGDDLLRGQRDNDTLDGEDGRDRVNGDSGNDTLFGGGGDDKLNGSAGNDVLVGGDGNDVLLGMNGADRLEGGSGDDILRGGRHNDFFIGGAGVDRIGGQNGTDTVSYETSPAGVVVSLKRGKADDDGFGSVDRNINGVENVIGSDSDDIIDGSAKRNTLDGRDGSDVLRGRGGNRDTLLNAGPLGGDAAAGGVASSMESSLAIEEGLSIESSEEVVTTSEPVESGVDDLEDFEGALTLKDVPDDDV